jgi:hypothetical protein
MGPPYPPQPVEIDMTSSRTLPSPSVSSTWDSTVYPSQGVGDVSTYIPPNVPRQSQLDTQGRSIIQDPIVNWYTGNDGPWIPKGISDVPDNRQTRQRTGNRIPNQYGTQFRQPVLSDAGSYQFGAPPSDSGYGSNGARRSDGNASIFSSDITDRDTDIHSLAGHVAEFQPYQGMVGEVLQSRDIRTNDQWPTTLGSSSISESSQHVCPTCHKTVKTRSELKYGGETLLYSQS